MTFFFSFWHSVDENNLKFQGGDRHFTATHKSTTGKEEPPHGRHRSAARDASTTNDLIKTKIKLAANGDKNRLIYFYTLPQSTHQCTPTRSNLHRKALAINKTSTLCIKSRILWRFSDPGYVSNNVLFRWQFVDLMGASFQTKMYLLKNGFLLINCMYVYSCIHKPP